MENYKNITATDAGEGVFQRRRRDQQRSWMLGAARDELLQKFENHPAVLQNIAELENQVVRGQITPRGGARSLLKHFLGD